MSGVKHCAIIGGGVIGGGWAARFLLAGHDVSVFDPHPEAERRLREMIGLAERALRKLTPLPLPARGRLEFEPSLAAAVATADLIQESAPEVESVKQSILAEIDRHARPEALICSSTSGLLPTRISAAMKHPERFVVAHPFNPVYLLPLVELCGGEKTAPETIETRPAVLRQSRDASAACPQGNRRLHRRSPARSLVARGTVARE